MKLSGNISGKTPSALARHLESRVAVLQAIIDGLRGKPFSWGSGEALSRKHILGEIGITLVTFTVLQKKGYKLNRGAKPVGTIYFDAPIQKRHPVYVLECQCYSVALNSSTIDDQPTKGDKNGD